MRTRSTLLAGLLGALVLLQPVPAPAAARAGTSGACPSLDDGVTVVVDRGTLGGGVSVRCAPGSPSSGLAALQAAGFSYGFLPQQPGLVCTIDGSPDPCNGAPSDAYWGYWHGSRSGGWTYATLGAGNRTPPVGSVEGWAFGDGQEPASPPPTAPSPPPSPVPALAPPSAPAPAPAPSPSPSPAATPPPSPSPSASPAPAPSPSTAPTVTAPSTTDLPGASAPSTTTLAGTGGGDAAPSSTSRVAADVDSPSGGLGASTPARADDRDDGGSAAPVLASLLLVAGVGGAGLVVARRRGATRS